MQTQFPIQYDWVRDNLHAGQEFCNQTSLLPPPPVSKNIAGLSTSQSSDIFKDLKFPEVLATQTPKTHIGQFTLGSTQSQVIAELGQASKTTQEYDLTILSYTTSDPQKPNVFIFDSSSKLIYFRVGKDKILDTFREVEPWTTNFKNPEGIIPSSVAYLSTRFIYPRAGFSFVASNDSGEVIQYEAFTPIYMDEYLDSWGKGVREEEVGYPTTHKRGDINRDLVVNNDDYSLFLPEFGKKGFSLSDIDWDRAVDGVDYVIWLNSTTPIQQAPGGSTPTPSLTPTPGGIAPTPTPSPTTTPSLSPTPIPTPISSLLINPGFESGTTGWTGVSGNASIVTTQLHGGAQSLQIIQPTSGTKSVRQSVSTITAGQNYSISAWIKTSLTTGSAGFNVFWLDSGGVPIWTTQIANVSGTTNWSQYSTNFTAPSGAVSALFWYGVSYGSGGTAWFDDSFMQ